MKRPIFAVASLLFLLLAPASAQTTRTRQTRAPYSGKDLAGSVEYGDIDSKLMGKPIRYGAYLPPGYKDTANAQKRYPVVFFLHGLWEDSESWLGRRGGAALFDAAIKDKKIPPLIVIIPDAGMSFYSDTLNGKKPYARFFIEEVVPWADKTFRTTAKREERIMAGASMGGFGALRFAFHHPELFSAVVVHSPAILPESPAEVSARGQRVMGFLEQNGVLEQLFGDPIDLEVWKAANPLTLAQTCDLKPGLDIYVDCGDADSYGFDDGCRLIDEVLTKRKIPHEFAIRPGGHGWAFMQSAFPHSLEFINKHLKAALSSAGTASPKKAEDGAASRSGG